MIQGDALEVLPTLGKVDAVVTDPPYSVSVSTGSGAFTRKGRKGTRNFNFFAGDDDWSAMRETVCEAVALAVRTMPKSVVVWCGHRQFGAIIERLEALGYSSRPLVWRKLCPPPAPPGAGFASGVELAVYAYLPGRPWNGAGNENNVFLADNYRHGQPGKVAHPTQKPLSLIQWNVSRLTEAGTTVLDCFSGSGTTGVACVREGRRFIGVEIDANYFDIACERIRKEMAQPRLDLPPPPKPQQVGMAI
jgi:hypothetical protein